MPSATFEPQQSFTIVRPDTPADAQSVLDAMSGHMIKIEVTGPTGTNKSVLSAVLAKWLAAHGLPILFIDTFHVGLRPHESPEELLKCLSRDVPIAILTTTTGK